MPSLSIRWRTGVQLPMIFRYLKITVPFIWFGMVAIISFMEAPMKFQAPNITVELGVGIGRLVFQTLNKIELVLASLLIISYVSSRPSKRLSYLLLTTTVAILLMQTFWLLPALDIRAEVLLNGNPPPPSNLHFAYIASDAAKVILLLVLGTISLLPIIREQVQ